MKILTIYLIIINIISFLFMYIDKNNARKHLSRIPEKTLFLTALLGGSLGSILGMNLFRHKTKHWYFALGMPLILIVQLLFAYWLLRL